MDEVLRHFKHANSGYIMPGLKFVSKAKYKRDYAFRMNVIEEIFEIRSCV